MHDTYRCLQLTGLPSSPTRGKPPTSQLKYTGRVFICIDNSSKNVYNNTMAKCILEIKDEVNVRFRELDAATRRKLSDTVKYFLPYAYHMPAYKLGRWDGCVRFCDVGGRSYLNLLDKLLPIVQGQGYEIEIDDQRPQWQFEFDQVTQTSYEHVAWPKRHPSAGLPIILREYQVEVINRFLDNPQCLQEVATGAGKTLITAVLSHRCENYGRTVVIVPNKDLVVQTEKDYRNLGLDVGVLYGDRKEYDKTHTICTWQSLAVLEKNTKAGEAEVDLDVFLDNVVCIMVDECFAPGTPVLTPSGYVPIESLCAGDAVVNYDENTGKFKHDTVVKLHTNLSHSASEKMYRLSMDNGTVIEVTGNHKFLTDCGWIRADELTPEHNIVCVDK